MLGVRGQVTGVLGVCWPADGVLGVRCHVSGVLGPDLPADVPGDRGLTALSCRLASGVLGYRGGVLGVLGPGRGVRSLALCEATMRSRAAMR